MAKKDKKEFKSQETTSAEALKKEAPKEEKLFIKPFCKCITPFGTFEKDKFIAVSKEIVDHLETHGIKFERAN